MPIPRRCPRPLLALIGTLALIACSPDTGPRTFDSMESAAAALAVAARDDDTRALRDILGPNATTLIDSGDPVADRDERRAFFEAYTRRHSLIGQATGARVLQVGEVEWPFPIPLVQNKGRWHFDATAGAEELVARRIGRNELGAIAVCREYVDTQTKFASVGHDGAPAGRYALLEPPPFHGYLFRVLSGQTRAARGGARSYRVGGEQAGGFALVAYPARYGASGVMTFIVNQDGIVYQKDLGARTLELAKAMSEFDPGASWEAVPGPGYAPN